MSRNVVGILGTAIIAAYMFGSGRLVATDTQWYRTLIKPAWSVCGICAIWLLLATRANDDSNSLR